VELAERDLEQQRHDDDGSRTVLFINIKTKFSGVQQFPTSLAAYGAGNATGNDE
jgi:hypothetical protein